MAVLFRQSDGFDERNLFLQVTLGLLSLGDRLEALLAPSASAPVSAGDRESPHPVELMLLGAIATSEHLRGRLADIVQAPVDPPPSMPLVDAPSPRPDALRCWLT